MAKPKRKQADWEAIEREYRAGQLSVSEIARQHGITEGAIRKRAKAEGWTRDLAGKVIRAPYGSVAKPDLGEWVFDHVPDVVSRVSALAGEVNRVSTNEGEIEHCVICMFARHRELCAEFGWPDVSNVHRQVHLGSAIADVLVAHTDGSLTVIEVKAKHQSTRDYATGIGQLHHQRALLAEWLGIRPIRMVIAAPGPISEDMISMCASSGVDIFPTPSKEQWRQFIAEATADVEASHGQA